MYGVKRPKKPIPGSEFAGEVTAIGKDVSKFIVGDRVFGSTGMRFGANAEYIVMAENDVVTRMPLNMNYIEAAGVPFAASAALHFLKEGNIQPGQDVLINGASGGVGSPALPVRQ